MNKKFLKKTFIFIISFFVFFSVFLNIIPLTHANLYDSNGTGAHYLDLIGENGFDQNSKGAPSTSIMDVIIIIINAILSFLGIIFLALIIYGGYAWMFSAGNDQKIEKAKKIIANSSIGVAIVLASAAISQLVIKTINDNDMDVNNWMNSDKSVIDIIVSIINIALSVFGVLFLGMIIYSGYTWMFSRGNEEKVGQAKKMLTSSVIGAIIIMLSFAIVRLVSTTVGG